MNRYEQQLIDNLDKSGECWIYTGRRLPSGYGMISDKLTHRLAYEIFKGEIPDGFDVAHECDNPPCCNPDHLKACTRKENMQDCVKRGRMKNDVNKLSQQIKESMGILGCDIST
jgi:hypothetical protein